jgi:hypothetical protein
MSIFEILCNESRASDDREVNINADFPENSIFV